MNRRAAREIRFGIECARDVLAGKRMRPQLAPFGFTEAPETPLWQRAYHRERSAMVRDGRIKPPRGGSGASR